MTKVGNSNSAPAGPVGKLARETGLEPATSGVTGRQSHNEISNIPSDSAKKDTIRSKAAAAELEYSEPVDSGEQSRPPAGRTYTRDQLCPTCGCLPGQTHGEPECKQDWDPAAQILGPLTYSPQDGLPRHCYCAQVWGPDGKSLAIIEPTDDPALATAYAVLFAAAPKQAAQIAALVEENSALAADQCHAGYASDHGGHGCREVDQARAQIAVLVEALHVAREFVEDEKDNRYAAIVDSAYSLEPSNVLSKIDAAIASIEKDKP